MPLPNLRVPRDQATKKIAAQLQKGREIRHITEKLTASKKDLETARAEKTKWVKYTTSLLEQLFDNTSLAQEFSIHLPQPVGINLRTLRPHTRVRKTNFGETSVSLFNVFYHLHFA